MNVKEAILNRRSVRAYLDKPVDKKLVNEVLELANWAPSMSNVQPWSVYVIPSSSPVRQEIVDGFWKRLKTDPEVRSPFIDPIGYPPKWKNPYLRRKRINGLQVYKALGVPRDDPDGKDKHWANNYNSFSAPIQIFFAIDEIFTRSTLIDYGCFIQNLNLAALEKGLGTCMQGSLGEYWEQAKEILNVPPNMNMLGGMALGYIDHEAEVNTVHPSREPLESFVTYVD